MNSDLSPRTSCGGLGFVLSDHFVYPGSQETDLKGAIRLILILTCAGGLLVSFQPSSLECKADNGHGPIPDFDQSNPPRSVGATSAVNDRDLVPPWAQPGQFRFARWDGGPVEVAKGVLSGWPSFLTPDPEVIFATTNWYEPKTIDLLVRAHVNWIWITWSASFSNESERWQQTLLANYIKECHRRGIHVNAYLSTQNMFWEDMFQRVPESKRWVLMRNGQPVPYGAANYQGVGRVTRYMADLSQKGWQDYVMRRALAAVAAGADGLSFDNNSGTAQELGEFKRRVLTEARKENARVLVNSNYHAETYLAARYENAITTEDGREPGIYSDPQAVDIIREMARRGGTVKVRGGELVTNIGLLRSLWAVSEEWRPVIVEDGGRYRADPWSQQLGFSRFLRQMSPHHLKLAAAECQAFHASLETYQEGLVLRDLYFGKRGALKSWDAYGEYNVFFERNAALYSGPVSLAQVAVVTTDKDLPFLNMLAARNLIYDVIYDVDASRVKLDRYALVIAAPSVTPREGWKRYETLQPAELEAVSPVRVVAPDSVLVNVYGQKGTKRTLVQLLNYADAPVNGVEVMVRGKFSQGELLSPDPGTPKTPVPVEQQGEYATVRIPKLVIYGIIALE